MKRNILENFSVSMRVVGIVVVLGLGMSSPASAFLMNFNTTGNKAERNDQTGYRPSQGFGPVGGPAANNSLGYAFEFEVAPNTTKHFQNILADIAVYDFADGADDVLDFDFKIYGGTTLGTGLIPDINTLFGQQHVTLRNSLPLDQIYDDYATGDFNLNLNEGSYWLAYERDFGQSTAKGFISDVKYQGNVVVNPEPATMGLFALGLFGAHRAMRKKK